MVLIKETGFDQRNGSDQRNVFLIQRIGFERNGFDERIGFLIKEMVLKETILIKEMVF